MASFTRLRDALVTRVLEGPGLATPDARRAAFAHAGTDTRTRALLDKVTRHAWTITDADVASVKGAGVSEDEIFELTVCAAIGQATRQLDAALAVLDVVAPPPARDPGAPR